MKVKWAVKWPVLTFSKIDFLGFLMVSACYFSKAMVVRSLTQPQKFLVPPGANPSPRVSVNHCGMTPSKLSIECPWFIDWMYLFLCTYVYLWMYLFLSDCFLYYIHDWCHDINLQGFGFSVSYLGLRSHSAFECFLCLLPGKHSEVHWFVFDFMQHDTFSNTILKNC